MRGYVTTLHFSSIYVSQDLDEAVTHLLGESVFSLTHYELTIHLLAQLTFDQ